MTFTKPEKIILIFLAVSLFAGSAVLHLRYLRARHDITIVKNGFAARSSLSKIQKELDESQRVDINTAALDKLVNIPGIGDTLASEIIKYRDSNGPFLLETDLLKVKGIGKKKFEKMRKYIKVGD